MCPLYFFLDCIMTTCLSMCAPAQLSQRPKVTHLFIVTLQESLRDRVIESWLLLWQQLLRCCLSAVCLPLWALFVSVWVPDTRVQLLWAVMSFRQVHRDSSLCHLAGSFESWVWVCVCARLLEHMCLKQLCVVTVKTLFQQTEYVLRIMYCVF